MVRAILEGNKTQTRRAVNPLGEYIWSPSIHMPRWASRIDLEITRVRVERLQDISESDARAEGVDLNDWYTESPDPNKSPYRYAFAQLWDSINAKKHPWSSNPWVWVIEFRKI